MSGNGLILLACAGAVAVAQLVMVYTTERNRRAAKVWCRTAAKHAEDARDAARRAAEYLTSVNDAHAATQRVSWSVEKMGNAVHNDAEAALALRKDCQTAAQAALLHGTEARDAATAARCAAASVLPDAEVSRDGS